jgi:hypothetical protein
LTFAGQLLVSDCPPNTVPECLEFWSQNSSHSCTSTFSSHGSARSLRQCLTELVHSTTASKTVPLIEEGLARPVALAVNDLAVILRTFEVYNLSGQFIQV